MIRRPPRSTLCQTLFPYTTLFRSWTLIVTPAPMSTLSKLKTAIPLLSAPVRSEEHTCELQSPDTISYAVFCLKQKKNNNIITYRIVQFMKIKYIYKQIID